jgi:hypothetical protein
MLGGTEPMLARLALRILLRTLPRIIGRYVHDERLIALEQARFTK